MEDIKNEIPMKFEIDILAKRTKTYPSIINFDAEQKLIVIKTRKEIERVELKISFNDLIGFIPENRMDGDDIEEFKTEIDKQFKNVYLDRKEFQEKDIFMDKSLAHINYFPVFSKKNCSCCGWICCKCTETKIERRAKNIEILIPTNSLLQITHLFNQITLFNSIDSVRTIPRELNYKSFKRKMLLFINPIGGKGHAMNIWDQVRTIFKISDIEVEVFSTQHYKHAYQHTLVMDFRKYNGIICCSGDGLIHEVVNGIFHREDKEEFLNSVPIGVIPGGTSNGFAKSLCEASKEECNPENCAYIISKNKVREVDVLEIEFASIEDKVYAFLSVSWGIIADVDLESEVCRCFGPLRFTIYGAFRWMRLRNTFGALYYLPQDSNFDLDKLPNIKTPLEESDVFIRENAQFYYFWGCNIPFAGETINCAPQSKIDDGFCDLIKMKSSAGKCNLMKQLFNQDSGDYFVSETNKEIRPNLGLEYAKTKCWRLIPKNRVDQSDHVEERRQFNTFYSIDGERYAIEPIQVKNLHKKLKVFCF